MPERIKRVIIEQVNPQVDGGRFPARRAVGELVRVKAGIFADGHDQLAAELLYRKQGTEQWQVQSMQPMVNDWWKAEFRASEIGIYEYTLQAWIDRFRTWLRDTGKKFAAGQDVSVDMIEGAQLVAAAAARADEPEGQRLEETARLLRSQENIADKMQALADPELPGLMDAGADRGNHTAYGKVLRIRVEPAQALFSTWYEMFPRSCAGQPGQHGTFKDCIARLEYIAEMGFDVLYLPPVHPIGTTYRKGRNNAPEAGPDDPGSPWAIGAPEGGHRAIHPQLGTLDDFKELQEAARARGIDIALDIAFQTSPDHPYVREHPEWFRKRADGTIQYAENPPKKYQDIYPLDFESEAAEALSDELLDVVRFWVGQGVRIFRVDNPHTKPLRFWEWLIAEIKQQHPEVIFLSEAFTRPKTMYRLAKGGFTQSYTYFTWRNVKWELESYFEELTQDEASEFFWPNLWPNTPDILPEFLQVGGRQAFLLRLALAATLSSNYGIYGPAFELCESEAKEPFSEEYLNSEKYEIRHWDLNKSTTIRGFIRRINHIRKQNPALQQTRNLRFHPVEREEIICFSKHTDDLSNIIIVAANLDPHHTHSAWLKLPVEEWGMDPEQTFQVHDLVSEARYLWQADFNYVEMNPQIMPVHIFRLRKRLRSEHDFDYFM
jgi:starch synthase (maltosyl-transferring)